MPKGDFSLSPLRRGFHTSHVSHISHRTKSSTFQVLRILPTDKSPVHVTCFAATADLSCIAVGLQSGAVKLFRGNILRERKVTITSVAQ